MREGCIDVALRGRQCAVAQLGVTLGANERYELRGSVRLGEGVRDMGDEVREQLERERGEIDTLQGRADVRPTLWM